MRKTDLQLKNNVEAELRWDPKINAASIGAAVDKRAFIDTIAVSNS